MKNVKKWLSLMLACVLITGALPVYAADEIIVEDIANEIILEEPQTVEENTEELPQEAVEEAEALPAEEGLQEEAEDSADVIEEEAPEEDDAFEDGYYYIRSMLAEDLLLSVPSAGKTNAEPLRMVAASKSDAQLFNVTFDEESGTYTITAQCSGLALDVKSGRMEDGTVVQQYTPNGTVAQQWFIDRTSPEDAEVPYYSILSAKDPVMALDVKDGEALDGAFVQIKAFCDAPEQQWVFEKVEIDGEEVLPEEEQTVEEEPKEEPVEALMETEAYASIENGTYTIASALNTNYVLDIASGSKVNKGNVQLYKSNHTKAQQFVFTHIRNNYYKISNVNSGLVLDVSGGKSANKTNVQQYKWNGSAAQTWRLVSVGNGYYEIQSTVAADKVLDVSGGKVANRQNIQIYKRNGTKAQRFKLTRLSQTMTSNTAPAEGVYTIYSAVGSNFVLDVKGGSVDNNANIQIYSSNGTNAQKWRLKKNGNYYTIVSALSGKALDVTSGSKADGTNVRQYTANGTAAQNWKFVDAGGGYVSIVNANGAYLNVYDGYAKNGTNVCIWQKDGSIEQKFKLISTSINTGAAYTDTNGTLKNYTEKIVASAKTYGPQEATAKKTLGTFLRNALVPVGRTLYIWGGGHNSSKASTVDACIAGYQEGWEQFYRTKATAGYNYLDYQYRYGAGLDCSGYVGWTLYNTVYAKDNQGWLVWTSSVTAENIIKKGWADSKYSVAAPTKFYPGDVVSMNGHVWISLGQCDDGSVVLVHSSPNGVQISGTVDSKGAANSDAYKLANKYMNKYYPNWPYDTRCCGKNYVKSLKGLAHWKVSGSGALFSDPEGYQKMEPEKVLKNLLGSA